MNAIEQAYIFLEEKQKGLYAATIEAALANGGIIHGAHDCVFMGMPNPGNNRTLVVLFSCGDISALWRLARMYSGVYDSLTWQRAFKGKYTWTSVSFAQLLSHNPKPF